MAKKLTRQALGCDADLGHLYDVRTDCLCNENIFESPSVATTETEDIQISDFRSIHSYDVVDVLSMLEMEGEQKLSVICRLCNPKGLAAHLISEAQFTSSHGPMLGIVFTFKTQKKVLSLSGDGEGSSFKAALKNSQASHAIEVITYGVRTFLSLECKNAGISANEIDDHLTNMLKIGEDCVETGQPFETHQTAIEILNDVFKIEIFSDLSDTKKQAESFQRALEYMKDVPNLVKENNEGIGLPLSFVLMPISEVEKPHGLGLLQTTPDEHIVPVFKYFDEIIKIQREVNKVYDDIQDYDAFVSEKDIDSISTMKIRFEESLKKFQKDLAGLLTKERFGSNSSCALKLFLSEAEKRAYSPRQVKQKLTDLKGTLKKVELIKTLQGMGVKCMRGGDKLKEVLAGTKANVYVVHYSTKANKKNKNLWKTTEVAFRAYASSPDNVCFLVDNDFSTGQQQNVDISIRQFKNGKMVPGNDSEEDESDSEEDESDFEEDESDSENVSNEDDLNDQYVDARDHGVEYEKNNEKVCYVKSVRVEPTKLNPRKKAYLKMQCPGAMGKFPCSGEIKTWFCQKCQSIVMFGFDEKFYCACGNASCHSYLFFCNERTHGSEKGLRPYSQSNNAKFIGQLKRLEPLKELNILIMGETGVGKSTWINSFVNYLTYDTMEEAEKHGPKYIISSSFVMTDENYKKVKINMGPIEQIIVEDGNNTMGESVTQVAKSYIFTAGELAVRLIDTPGIGDTRGIEHDKVNFQNILSHLSHLEVLHGICILLKCNSARLTTTFQFCIKELLTHLHKNACQNIVFVFTNARETFYRPGDTFGTLESLLLGIKDIAMELGRETVYCMDNESMRFLAASNQGMKFNDEDKKNYSKSWKMAVAENERLVQHILALRPHSAKQTLSLNEARRLILALTEPLVQISQNIDNNITLAEQHKRDIQQRMANKADLAGKLHIPIIDIEAREIPFPRTVCTSPRCVQTKNVLGITKVNYTTRCHDHCSLLNVQVQTYPCPELQRCAAMDSSLKCKVCKCSWEKHMHLTYDTVEVDKNVIDENVQALLVTESDGIKAADQLVDNIQKRVTSLKGEQTTINKVASKCGTFLKQNAITPYNDTVDEYLQQCIRVQQDQVYAGASDETLKGLQRMLANYRQEVNILEMSMKDFTSGHRIDPNEIPKLIEELYALPISGASLKAFVDVAKSGQEKMVAYNEQFYSMPYRKKGNFVERALDTGKKTLAVLADIF